jgi:amidohydrolase|tara:strand:- start:2267 stop:3553 length:1287 start_codon:yes stop_codon:yes gene_type:complete
MKLLSRIFLISFFLPAIAFTEVDLNELYIDLHQNPELSFQEEETSQKLAQLLKDMGFEVTPEVGGFGVVAVFENGPGKTLMIRADMDALPLEEKTGAKYASKKKSINQVGAEVFTMHACGHDIHMTSLIGTAQNLIKMREDWSGTLVLNLQPAEERGSGARAMIRDGIFERFPRPDFNLALHVSADLPAGKVAYVPGWAMANVDSMDIIVKGIGGHGAYPHKTIDPIVLSAQLINNIQTIRSREISPLDAAVVTVGSIHGGTKHNIIPSEVTLQLTLRSYTDEVRNNTISSIKRISRGLADSVGLPEELYPVITLKDEYTPALYNNPEFTETIRLIAEEALGKENVIKSTPVMGGEDFGMYGRVEPKIPSVLFWLGAVNKKVYDRSKREDIELPSLHSPFFLPDYKPSIETGVKVTTAMAINILSQPE